MIHSLTGRLAHIGEGAVVIETAGGVGYWVNIPDQSPLYGGAIGETIRLFTEMIVREDDVSLYGFTESEALDWFRQLRTVNGIGAKAALAILSALSLAQIRQAILAEDVEPLTRANGIGKKTAQRILLELKDRVGSMAGEWTPGASASPDDQKEEAVSALLGLGYSRSEALLALTDIDPTVGVEEAIKTALRRMSGRR